MTETRKATVNIQLAGEERTIADHSALSGPSATRDIRSLLPLAQLPMMPQVLVRLLDLCHRDEVSFGDVASVIRRDAAMSAKIISVASSANYHGRSRPASLDQCLTLLGLSAIKMIVINESILLVFRRFTGDRDFDLRRFWGHSLRSALIARELAKALGYPNPDEAYLGGLMHDVGQLAMLAADSDTYSPLLLRYQNPEELCRREQAIFSLNHAEVGAWLVEKWELDSLLADSILYHHDPVERVQHANLLIRIVFLSNRLSALCGGAQGEADQILIDQFGASQIDVPPLLEKVEVEVVDLARQLGIELPEKTAPEEIHSSPTQTGIDELAIRVRDVLLVDRVLGDIDDLDVDGLNASLLAIAQAARLVFGVNPALCFLQNEIGGEHYSGRAIGTRWRKAALLEFKRGESDALAARAIEQGAIFIGHDERLTSLLDDQLRRMIGGTGVLLVPLRSRQDCFGVLVAGFSSPEHAASVGKRINCLEHFSSMAGEALRTALVAQTATPTASRPRETELPDIGERLQRLMHEISNPLSIIQNYLATLEIECERNNIGAHELGIVRDEIARVATILQDGLHMPDERTSSISAVNLNGLIEDLVTLCRASNFVDATVQIHTRLLEPPLELRTDGGRLKQLILNLLKNAIEAVAEKGGIVCVGTARWGDGIVNSHIEIRVEDSGPGIPDEVLSQLYRPVNSNKGGNHRGVGLSIVAELVRELHGLINCRSNDGGTRFQLLLPVDHA